MTSTRQTAIQAAALTWQTDDNGVTVPTSSEFGDVYFSKVDGLAESRYVFLDGNDLPERLSKLQPFERFVIGEIGFGTGLNVLATWQLWQQIRPDNNSHLHIITTEKFPLTKPDLAQALSVWPGLAPLAEQLIANYPPPLAGCHRLNFFAERLTLDIWLGDASDSLSQMIGQAKINAWLLDGFAPSCNDELWSDSLFGQIARLSAPKTSTHTGTTLATFSVASRVKTGLKQHGFSLQKRKGFGKKREMLTAQFVSASNIMLPSFSNFKFHYLSDHYLAKRLGKTVNRPPFAPLLFLKLKFPPQYPRTRQSVKLPDFALPTLPTPQTALHIAVIGAGVAGLSTAYALAVRGHQVTVLDKAAPLSGASGNIRGFLAPKLTSLERLPTNLHAIGYLASCRFYPALSAQTSLPILAKTGCLDLLSHSRVTAEEVRQMPSEFVQLLSAEQATEKLGITTGEAIWMPEAGLIDTANFAKAVRSHPNINFQKAELTALQQNDNQVVLTLNDNQQSFDHAVLCMALESCDFLPNVKPFNISRGQVSWFEINDNAPLPHLPIKYGSYFATFNADKQRYTMMGASFVRDSLDTTPALADHQINVDDLANALPQLVAENAQLLTPQSRWHGRARLRSQTVDYLPLVGQVWGHLKDGEQRTESRLWTFSALGSKGYAYAPICSELLAGLICGELLPLSQTMVEKLSPNRNVLKQ